MGRKIPFIIQKAATGGKEFFIFKGENNTGGNLPVF